MTNFRTSGSENKSSPMCFSQGLCSSTGRIQQVCIDAYLSDSSQTTDLCDAALRSGGEAQEPFGGGCPPGDSAESLIERLRGLPPADRKLESPDREVDSKTRANGVLRGVELLLRHHRAPKNVIDSALFQMREYLTCPAEKIFFKRAKFLLAQFMARYLKCPPPPACDRPFRLRKQAGKWFKSRERVYCRKNTHLFMSLLQVKRCALPLSEDMVYDAYVSHSETMKAKDPCESNNTAEEIVEALAPLLKRINKALRKRFKSVTMLEDESDDEDFSDCDERNEWFESFDSDDDFFCEESSDLEVSYVAQAEGSDPRKHGLSGDSFIGEESLELISGSRTKHEYLWGIKDTVLPFVDDWAPSGWFCDGVASTSSCYESSIALGGQIGALHGVVCERSRASYSALAASLPDHGLDYAGFRFSGKIVSCFEASARPLQVVGNVGDYLPGFYCDAFSIADCQEMINIGTAKLSSLIALQSEGGELDDQGQEILTEFAQAFSGAFNDPYLGCGPAGSDIAFEIERLSGIVSGLETARDKTVRHHYGSMGLPEDYNMRPMPGLTEFSPSGKGTAKAYRQSVWEPRYDIGSVPVLASMDWKPKMFKKGKRTYHCQETHSYSEFGAQWNEHIWEEYWEEFGGKPHLSCKIMAILEPLKIRIISKGNAVPYYLAKPFQKALHGIMRKMPVFRLIGQPLSPTMLVDIAENALSRELWCSIDYKSSTDGLSAKLSRLLMAAVTDGFDPEFQEVIQKTLRPHECEYPRCRDKSGKKLDQIDPVVQQNGQLMGSITSFPILCLANLGLYVVTQRRLGREETLDELMASVLVNGDDMLYPGSRLSYHTQEGIGGEIGLEFSVGKSYTHPRYANINSVSFDFDLSKFRSASDSSPMRPGIGRSSQPYQVTFLNGGLFFGQGKVMGKVGIPGESVDTRILSSTINELLSGALPGRQADILKQFISLHKRTLLHECRGRNLFVPVSLGGMGQLAPIGFSVEYTTKQRQWASSIYESNEHVWLGGRPYIAPEAPVGDNVMLGQWLAPAKTEAVKLYRSTRKEFSDSRMSQAASVLLIKRPSCLELKRQRDDRSIKTDTRSLPANPYWEPDDPTKRGFVSVKELRETWEILDEGLVELGVEATGDHWYLHKYLDSLESGTFRPTATESSHPVRGPTTTLKAEAGWDIVGPGLIKTSLVTGKEWWDLDWYLDFIE